MRAWVYILSNDSYLGLLKIGYSERDVKTRINELFSTGVPTPFKIEFACYVDAADEVESRTHSKLIDHRIPNREFFQIAIDTAIDTVRQVMSEMNLPSLLEEGEYQAVGTKSEAVKYSGKFRQDIDVAVKFIAEALPTKVKELRNFLSSTNALIPNDQQLNQILTIELNTLKNQLRNDLDYLKFDTTPLLFVDVVENTFRRKYPWYRSYIGTLLDVESKWTLGEEEQKLAKKFSQG